MGGPQALALAGVHHVKLPVTDLARSRKWYQSRLGYRRKPIAKECLYFDLGDLIRQLAG